MAASKSAISLVQGPANALVAARASTAQTRAAVILRLDIRSTPLFEADYSPKSGAPRGDLGKISKPRKSAQYSDISMANFLCRLAPEPPF